MPGYLLLLSQISDARIKVGDLHGQYWDFLNLLSMAGLVSVGGLEGLGSRYRRQGRRAKKVLPHRVYGGLGQQFEKFEISWRLRHLAVTARLHQGLDGL